MLLQSKTDYVPVPTQFVTLQPEELLLNSFLITETETNWSGYQLKSDIQYHCHFTNQRLLLEPCTSASTGLTRSRLARSAEPVQAVGDASGESVQVDCFQLPHSAIQEFKLVRTLTLTSYAKILLSPSHNNENDCVVAPQPLQRDDKTFCARAFVELGNGLLGKGFAGSSGFQPMQNNSEKVAQFKQTIQSHPAVLVDFSAPGCKPCDVFAPMLQEAMQPFRDRLLVVRVSLHEAPMIPMQYEVDCFPTVLLFKDGTVVERIVGVVPAAIVTKVLQRHL